MNKSISRKIIPMLMLITSHITYADTSVWTGNGIDVNWFNADNWDNGMPPSGVERPAPGVETIAEFGSSSSTQVTINKNDPYQTWLYLSSISFTEEALLYDINLEQSIYLNGDGVINLSSNRHSMSLEDSSLTVNGGSLGNLVYYVTPGQKGIGYINLISATAGNSTIYLNDGAFLTIQGSSTAKDAKVIGNNTTSRIDLLSSVSSIGSLSTKGTINLDGGKQLTLGNLNEDMNISGAISGTSGGSLIKIGTGTLTLEAINTHTGNTTVQEGKLQLDNGGLYGPVIVESGASIGGTGTIRNLTLNAGSILEVSQGDLLNITVSLSLGDSSVDNQIHISLLDLGLLRATDMQILSFASGGITDENLNHFNLVGYDNAALYVQGNSLRVNLTLIPEPSAYTFILGAFVLSLATTGRRRK